MVLWQCIEAFSPIGEPRDWLFYESTAAVTALAMIGALLGKVTTAFSGNAYRVVKILATM